MWVLPLAVVMISCLMFLLLQVDHSLAVAVAESLSLKCPTDGAPNHGKKTAFLSQINGKRQSENQFICLLEAAHMLTLFPSLYC